jgi:hypothetical protein
MKFMKVDWCRKNKAALGGGCDPRRGPRRVDHMITDTFDRRTIAKMEVALERACLLLPTGSEKRRARRIIAGKIIECANRGDATLSRLTEAGYAACGSTELLRALRQEERGRQLGLYSNWWAHAVAEHQPGSSR